MDIYRPGTELHRRRTGARCASEHAAHVDRCRDGAAHATSERLAQRHPGGGWHGLTPAQRAVRTGVAGKGSTAFLKTESTLHGPLRAWLTTSDVDD
jgi:hypothetical protein